MHKREWLKKARKEKNLTLMSLAEKIGCSFNYISDLEHGRRNPSMKMAKKFSDELDFNIIRFLETEGETA